ncbi:CDP-alcohol phosphatidyltransferase family protein [Rhizobiaceae bacterium]|nr:CDP-alcohol phosphatidyltransferase family protein [Rhizobiaceae bacterium]
MLDRTVRRAIDPMLNAIAAKIVRAGGSANAVTWAGFALAMAAAGFIAVQMFWAGLALLLASRLCDGLDGPVARAAGGGTDLGGFLDIVLDFAFYGAIPLAFIVADPSGNAISGGVLLLAFYVNGASFLTYALMAEKRGVSAEARGSKALLYTAGLAEGTETILVFVAMCLLPGLFAWLAYGFAAVTVATTATRFVMAYSAFGASSDEVSRR